jgi:hypothetical protein
MPIVLFLDNCASASMMELEHGKTVAEGLPTHTLSEYMIISCPAVPDSRPTSQTCTSHRYAVHCMYCRTAWVPAGQYSQRDMNRSYPSKGHTIPVHLTSSQHSQTVLAYCHIYCEDRASTSRPSRHCAVTPYFFDQLLVEAVCCQLSADRTLLSDI